MGEVLHWFDENGFEFTNAVPKTSVWEPFSNDERLFETARRGTTFERGLAQARMFFTGNREGGFYIMIGRKRD
jgi:hypothetical protein